MVTINIGRKEAVFFGVVILVFAVAGLAIAEWDSAKAMFHDSEDVKVTIDGEGDMSLQDAISGGFIGGGCSLGTRTNRHTDGSLFAVDNVYRASSDGFVSYTAEGNYGPLYFLTDSSSIPTTVLSEVDADFGRGIITVTMPVLKDDYWKIEKQGSFVMTVANIKWVPLNCGGGGSSGLSCHTVSNVGDLYSSEVQCDYGTATSGSCSHVDFPDCANSPFSEDIPKDNGWRCRAPECWSKNVISYAVCCE